MSKQIFTFTMDVEIYDPTALFNVALERMIEDGLDQADAVDMLKPGGDLDIGACLVAIFDPGVSPAGVQIQGSTSIDASDLL